MNRLVSWGIAGILLAGAAGLMVHAQQRQGVVFIAGDNPVTEEQVRAKLQNDGYSGVQIYKDGRYFQVLASKSGIVSKIAVDSQTGRLRAGNDDDDDDD